MKTTTMTLTSLLEYTYTILSVFFISVFKMVMACVKEMFNVCALVNLHPGPVSWTCPATSVGFQAAYRDKLVWFYLKPKSGANLTISHGFYGVLRFLSPYLRHRASPWVFDYHIWGFICCTWVVYMKPWYRWQILRNLVSKEESWPFRPMGLTLSAPCCSLRMSLYLGMQILKTKQNKQKKLWKV